MEDNAYPVDLAAQTAHDQSPPVIRVPWTEETAKNERRSMRSQITRLAKKAAMRQTIETTVAELDQMSDKLLELDEFLKEEEASPHYEKIGQIRVYLQEVEAAAAMASLNMNMAAQSAIATTSSTAPRYASLLQPPLHSTLMSPANNTAWPALARPSLSPFVTSTSTATTWSTIQPNMASNVPGSGMPILPTSSGPATSMPAFSAASLFGTSSQAAMSQQPSFQNQSGYGANSSFSFRRFPTTVKKEDVPRFDGRPSNWARFRDRFASTVGRNPNLEEIDKLELLSLAIPENAKTVLTYRSWDQALRELEEEIASPDDVTNDLFRTVNEVKVVTKQAKGSNWREFREEVKNLIRLTESKDASLKSQLHAALMRRLGEHRLDYIRLTGGRTLDDLNTYVGYQLQTHRVAESNDATVQATSSIQSHLPPAAHDRTVRFSGPPKPRHVHSIVGTEQSSKDACYFCDGPHLRKSCPLNMRQRTDGLRARGRCFRCLMKRSDPRHPANCQASCAHCGKPYHKFVCSCGQRRPPVQTETPLTSPTLPDQTPPSTESGSTASSRQTTPKSVCHVTIRNKGAQSEVPVAISPTDVTYLPTVRVQAESVELSQSCSARVFGDAGSMTTFVSEHLVDRLNASKMPTRPFKATVFGGGYTCTISDKVKLRIRSVSDPSVFNIIEAYVMKGTLVMPLPLPSTELLEVARSRGIRLADCSSEPSYETVDILLGEDQMEAVFYEEGMSRIKPNASLSFEETRYGWILRGHTGKPTNKYVNCTYMDIESNDDALEDLPRLFGVYHLCGDTFSTPPLLPLPVESKRSRAQQLPSSDDQGLEDDASSNAQGECIGLCRNLQQVLSDPLSDDGKDRDQVGAEWRASYDATLSYDEETKRYTAGLPWRSGQRPEPNLSAAKGFAFHMRNVLREKGQLQLYTVALMDFVKNGFAVELPYPYPEDGYFLLHFPVYKEGSTTPVRPVFNASSASKNQLSLNQALCKGFWNQTQLVHELLHLRTHRFILLGDIKQAFLQIRINAADRIYTRFLWFDDAGRLRAYEMTSLLFGAVSSPFILHAVLNDLFKRKAPELSHVISDTYMDDCLLYAETVDELKEKKERVSAVMAMASFALHKWMTTTDVAQALELPETKQSGSCLGVRLLLDEDQIVFKLPRQVPSHLTRRTLLSYFAQVFDPLGLLGPFHTSVKLMMRGLLVNFPAWDDPITDDYDTQARQLIHDLQEYLPREKFKRLVRTSDRLEVWVFGDASKDAYGICIYVHDCDDGQTELLLSRGHIPSQNKTIPELELVAAMLAAETFAKIKDTLSFDPICVRFFTDSQVTWYRIHSDPNKFPAFVMNRVRRIQSATSPDDWYFIPGTMNPADLVSRGMLLRNLHASDMWIHGPPRSAVDDAELRTQALRVESVHVNTIGLEAIDDFSSTLINNNDYARLRTALLTLLKLADAKMKVVRAYQQHYGTDVDVHLMTDILLWRLIQKVTMPDVWMALKSGRPVTTPSFANLPLILDKYGIIRLDRRLDNADMPAEVKRPLVLTDHPMVRSYIKYVHENHANHAGASTTKEYFRRFVHLSNCSRIVEEVVRTCLRCQRFRNARPYSTTMAPLPEDRVSVGFAFECVGVDLFGPLHAASGKLIKYYGMIFACAKSRAVHLELLESRSTEAILRAYLRFVGIYGEPKLIRSDNELGFIKLNKTIRANQEAFERAMKRIREHPKARNATWIDQTTPADSPHRVRWVFNVPDAPNWGGFYERLIQSVKRSLDRCRLLAADSYEKIETLMREVQLVVNSRPLVTNFADGTILTPAHLVLGRGLQNPAPVKYPMTERDDTLFEYSRLQHELERFWKIWEDEYLISLRNYKWNRTADPRINELVIIRKDGLPRYAWEMGRITKLFRGKDNLIRTVQVELIRGGSRNRQIRNVYPLEHPVGLGEDVAPRECASSR